MSVETLENYVELLDEFGNFVEPSLACPGCGERDADELVWIDTCRVQCQSCKKVYSPD